MTTTISTCSYRAWRPEYGTPVRITLGKAPWKPPGRERFIYLDELAPRPWYFRRSAETFAREYRAQLERLADDVTGKLQLLTERFGPVCLLCFERRVASPAECHRLQFAQWFTERTGHPVPELDGKWKA